MFQSDRKVSKTSVNQLSLLYLLLLLCHILSKFSRGGAEHGIEEPFAGTFDRKDCVHSWNRLPPVKDAGFVHFCGSKDLDKQANFADFILKG